MLSLHSELVSLHPREKHKCSYYIHDRASATDLGQITLNNDVISITTPLKQSHKLIQDAALAMIQNVFISQSLESICLDKSLLVLGHLLEFDIVNDHPFLSRKKFTSNWLAQRKTLEVAAGVIINDNEEILLGKRSSASTFSPGAWEFPGGKVEKGERLQDALVREIREELDIIVNPEDCQKVLYSVLHHYLSISVHFHVFQINNYIGNPMTCVHEKIQWVKLENVRKFTILQPDLPVIKLLQEQTRSNQSATL